MSVPVQVRDHAHHAQAAHGEHRQRQRVVAAIEGETLRRAREDLGAGHQIARRLLDRDDILDVARQANGRGRVHVLRRPARHVVEHAAERWRACGNRARSAGTAPPATACCRAAPPAARYPRRRRPPRASGRRLPRYRCLPFRRSPFPAFRTTPLTSRNSRSFSECVSVGDSPVVPATTIPSEPCASNCSTRRPAPASSTLPCASNGVTIAVKTCPKSPFFIASFPCALTPRPPLPVFPRFARREGGDSNSPPLPWQGEAAGG